MLNRRRFLRNMLGAGAALATTPALAAMKEAGYALPESLGNESVHRLSDSELEALLSRYPTVFSCQVKVITVRSVTFRDHSMQVNIDCLCLDSCLNAFKIDLIFFPQSVAEREAILSAFKVDSILAVKGDLGLFEDDGDISLYVNEYRTVEHEFARWFRDVSAWGERGHYSLPLEWDV